MQREEKIISFLLCIRIQCGDTKSTCREPEFGKIASSVSARGCACRKTLILQLFGFLKERDAAAGWQGQRGSAAVGWEAAGGADGTLSDGTGLAVRSCTSLPALPLRNSEITSSAGLCSGPSSAPLATESPEFGPFAVGLPWSSGSRFLLRRTARQQPTQGGWADAGCPQCGSPGPGWHIEGDRHRRRLRTGSPWPRRAASGGQGLHTGAGFEASRELCSCTVCNGPGLLMTSHGSYVIGLIWRRITATGTPKTPRAPLHRHGHMQADVKRWLN